jgi:hypothetical protein
MRYLFALSLAGALLAGCASQKPVDPNGIWINQSAIDAAAQGGSLRQALLANGPNLEWGIDTQSAQAVYSNGFEQDEGQLVAQTPGKWKVDFYGSPSESLEIKGDRLTQAASESGPQQTFVKAKAAPAGSAEVPPGTAFEEALYRAYLGGDWKIVDGPGMGGTVRFSADGRVEGLPSLDRYALCLAGDCAAMSGEYDSLWMEKNEQGSPFIFKRDGNRLEILQAINQAKDTEMPDLHPGTRRWLLQK